MRTLKITFEETRRTSRTFEVTDEEYAGILGGVGPLYSADGVPTQLFSDLRSELEADGRSVDAEFDYCLTNDEGIIIADWN